jgi:hypothetical protein
LIESHKWYRIAYPVSPDYFKKKYGTENPLIYIHGTDKALLGCSYLDDSRPVSIAFFQRIAGKTERLPEEGMYGGKVKDREGRYLSELVMRQELEAYEGPDPR